jgi:hypothetical protein
MVVEGDLKRDIRAKSDPNNHQVVMAGMEATWWLNEPFTGLVASVSTRRPAKIEPVECLRVD